MIEHLHGDRRSRRNGLAVASITLGVLGMLCFGPLAQLPGIVIGHIALIKSRREPGRHGTGPAIAGLAIGYAGLALFIALFGVRGGI